CAGRARPSIAHEAAPTSTCRSTSRWSSDSPVFSLFDRLFFTFTPSKHGVSVVYGLHGSDDPATQTTAGLLAIPFRGVEPSGGRAAATAQAAWGLSTTL